jgi:hypothetical protein
LFFLFLIIITTKSTEGFRDLREADVSAKSVDSISVLWGPRGDHPGRCPLKPALLMLLEAQTHYIFFSFTHRRADIAAL